jgi:hypothetical protein
VKRRRSRRGRKRRKKEEKKKKRKKKKEEEEEEEKEDEEGVLEKKKHNSSVEKTTTKRKKKHTQLIEKNKLINHHVEKEAYVDSIYLSPRSVHTPMFQCPSLPVTRTASIYTSHYYSSCRFRCWKSMARSSHYN